MRNSTQLIFCNKDVNPNDVTRLLGLTPSESVSVGDTAVRDNGHQYISHLGIWKHHLINADFTHTVEEQIAQWLQLLEPKSAALGQLKALGYRPYLDCKADQGSLSLCVEPDLLVQLGKLNIALSVWLYEQSPTVEA